MVKQTQDATEQVDIEEEDETEEQPEADVQETEDEGDVGTDPEKKEEEAEPDGGELVVSIGEPEQEEEEARRAPQWVQELRKSHKETVKALRRAEEELARHKASAKPQAIVIGDEPTMDGCDYDPDKYATELKAWIKRKQDAEGNERVAREAEERQRAQWQTRIDAVQKAAAGLRVADYEDASETLDNTFSIVQMGILMGGPDDAKTSALLRYALGKNPKKAKELAGIADPVKFTFALAKLESQMKVTSKKAAPAPDKPVRSSVSGAAAVDSTLARLEAEADKTGNRSKVAAYLRGKMKSAGEAS